MYADHPHPTNFAHLQAAEAQLHRLGVLAEQYLRDDPNTSLIKQRQFAELLAQSTASRLGLFDPNEAQYDLLRRLSREGVLSDEVFTLFDEVRRVGNKAAHTAQGDARVALDTLKYAWMLSVWYHRTFHDPEFRIVDFVTPQPNAPDLSHEVRRLQEEVERARAEAARHLADLQARSAGSDRTALRVSADRAAKAVHLTEEQTRQLIDRQLEDAGWTADSRRLRYHLGVRPEKGKNLAIAEWPTASGPADYVLFLGLTPVAVVEAKRKAVDVPGALEQAKRYSRDFVAETVDGALPGGPWGEYRLPFVFATNGRAYLKQLHTQSGVWFRDVRRPHNLARALTGWYTPKGLQELLDTDVAAAEQQLEREPLEYDLGLRPYQKDAIRAVERALANPERDRSEFLLAMATGTGKTKTCIALIYRLLKAKRFRRVLFLVDRKALGVQATNAFKDTRMQNLQTFADIFGIKSLEDAAPDSDTAVHVATVQGMVHRLFDDAEDAEPLPVDAYDCIVVDECHRGYTLDRELSPTEHAFRDEADYISKYRRVLEHFDAVKVGLTATPALHTTEIFGAPIFTYSYREAVLDGYLIDHEPPVQIHTELSESGIRWQAGAQVKVYDPAKHEVQLFETPDHIGLDVEDFNKKVITESFNRAVCGELARQIDPNGPEKTLVFCANDAHADLVVDLLKRAFEAQYGEVDDDAVVKITGTSDKPLELIRKYKNERLPTVAVTVDLLTTGVDVPPICNLVFLRRVGSRILFDQMLGRATRRDDEIGKETFRIYDAVRAYEALANFTDMKPVVVNPSVTFAQLAQELAKAEGDEERAFVRDQFVAKLQGKGPHLGDDAKKDFERVTGMTPAAFAKALRQQPLEQVAAWFTRHEGLAEVLDRQNPTRRTPVLISEHEDRVTGVERGYGNATRPEDYLSSFQTFIREKQDEIPALVTVLTRPRDLTRKDLRALVLALDKAGFTETHLQVAWREAKHVDIAARLVGYIRALASGDPLVPFDQRVDEALSRVLSAGSWTQPQRTWLARIAQQIKKNDVVDRDVFNDQNGVFRQYGADYARLNKIFDGKLEHVLADLNDAIWAPRASA